MNGGLEFIAKQCHRPADAVRWACILEATAPKAGNVYPGRDFGDLTYIDFVTAAEITASCFDQSVASFSESVLRATERIARTVGTNVNLGILLLLGPIVESDPWGDASLPGSTLTVGRGDRSEHWKSRVITTLESLTKGDSIRLYGAINTASPGGMGQADDMDLAGPPPDDFVAAMQAAKSWDRIARNYADGFSDLFDTVVPMLASCIEHEADLLAGIAIAHLRLLAAEPDTLIARKFGQEVALQVQRRANFDPSIEENRESFDRFLRTGVSDGQGKFTRINPGTTADLIAAGLYILLRQRD